jgi:anti-sigma B factor antagonist
MSSPAGKLHYFEWEDAGGVAVVRFTTKVIREDEVIRAVFDNLVRLVDEGGVRRMIINFGGLEAFASFAIGRLIALHDRLSKAGGELILCNLSPLVAEIVDIMSLRKRFKIRNTEQDALQALA